MNQCPKQAQPADENGSSVCFLVADTSGHTFITYDNKVKGWIDTHLGETAEARLIGAEIEKHMQFDDSPQEDAGIDNPEFDASQSFTGWYKLSGKKYRIRIRIEPVLASPRSHYHIYNLNSERVSDMPERILLYSSELNDCVEKDTELEYNSWLDREKGYLHNYVVLDHLFR